MNCNKLIRGAIVIAVVSLITGTGWAMENCKYSGVLYSQGSFTCQSGYGYKCNDGSWDIQNTACSTRTHESSEDKTVADDTVICGCSKDEKNYCYAVGQFCNAEGDASKCVKQCK